MNFEETRTLIDLKGLIFVNMNRIEEIKNAIRNRMKMMNYGTKFVNSTKKILEKEEEEH